MRSAQPSFMQCCFRPQAPPFRARAARTVPESHRRGACYLRCRPYFVENTRSHSNSEVKQRKARLVPRWGTARENLRVLTAFVAGSGMKAHVDWQRSRAHLVGPLWPEPAHYLAFSFSRFSSFLCAREVGAENESRVRVLSYGRFPQEASDDKTLTHTSFSAPTSRAHK